MAHRVLECTAVGCGAAWYQFDSDHGRAMRRAFRAGWTAESKWGCACVNPGQLCPDHAAA